MTKKEKELRKKLRAAANREKQKKWPYLPSYPGDKK
jgi:hypothetical protein